MSIALLILLVRTWYQAKLDTLQDDVLINVARLCFGLNMFTTLPLEVFVCREVSQLDSARPCLLSMTQTLGFSPKRSLRIS